jgi:hypothetical protein
MLAVLADIIVGVFVVVVWTAYIVSLFTMDVEVHTDLLGYNHYTYKPKSKDKE